jgi:FkbM family methyltransferase
MFFKEAEVRLLLDRYPSLKKSLYPILASRRYLLNKKDRIREKVYLDLCGILAEDPVVSVPEFPGKFALDCKSDIFKRILFHKTYEPTLVKQCIGHLQKDRDVIDVGANVGFYTVLFARAVHGRKVLAIEPSTRALLRLRRNIALNNIGETTIVFDGAASSRSEEAYLNVVNGKEEYSSLGAMVHPSIVEEECVKEKVSTSTIDELVQRYSLDPGFIKVDVEGYEQFVFDGAKTTLETKRPIILSELSDPLLRRNGSSAMAVIETIRRHNYEVIDPITPEIPVGRKEFGDILCLPLK